MIIDNGKSEIKIKLVQFLLLLVFAVLVAILYGSSYFIESVYGITSRNVVTIVFAGIIVAFFTVEFILLDLHYVYYSDNGQKIIFRFYPLNPFRNKRTSFEIFQKDFIKFEVKKSMMNLRENVVIYQITPKGLAKYPPINISLFKKADKDRLFSALHKFEKHKVQGQ